MSLDYVVELHEVVVDYHHNRALDHLSLKVHKGDIFGFIGPNGAGKTTTIKVILGLISAAKGTVLLQGLSPLDPKARAKVGFLPEETTYYRFLTPVEILTFCGEIFHLSKSALKKRIQELLQLVGLSEVQHKPIRFFSKGMAQKIGLAQALMNDPDVLILDEPTSGLDPLARMELRKILAELKNHGKTIFFSSHELSEIELLCDSVAIIQNGKLIQSGTLAELLQSRQEQSLERFFLDTIQKGGHV